MGALFKSAKADLTGFHSGALVHETPESVRIFQFLLVPADGAPGKFELHEVRNDSAPLKLSQALPIEKAREKARQHFNLRAESLGTAGGALRVDLAFVPNDSRYNWQALQ